jgi:hypothetical protein
VVVVFDTAAFTARALLAALKIDYHPQWVVQRSGSNPELIGPLLSKATNGQVDASALNGLVTDEWVAGPNVPGNGWSELWQKVWQKHGDGKPLTTFQISGMAWAYTFLHALAKTGNNPTRSELLKAFDSMGGPGLVDPAETAFGWSRDSRQGMTGGPVMQVENGTISKRLTPALVTTVGDSPVIEDTSGDDKDAPPASGIPTS